jgi:hypothetical protein
MAASRPKVTFDQIAAPVLEIMDDSLYYAKMLTTTFPLSSLPHFQVLNKYSINMTVTSSRHVSSKQTDTH